MSCPPDSTSAVVNFGIFNNVTWQDALRFGDEDDTSWDFTGQSFIMEIKGNRDDSTVLLELTSAAGEIVVDSVSERVLHLNVAPSAIQAALKVGEYVYDFIMFDGSATPVRVMLMRGELCVKQGVTGD